MSGPNFVTPKKIVSPISGQLTAPRLVEKIVGDKIYIEAHWFDPASGTFLQRGVVEIRDRFPKK
jgi:hypothetical protein